VLGRHDDSIQRWLHGASRNAEGLEEVGADAKGDDDGDPEDFDVLFKPIRRFVVAK